MRESQHFISVNRGMHEGRTSITAGSVHGGFGCRVTDLVETTAGATLEVRRIIGCVDIIQIINDEMSLKIYRPSLLL